MLSRVFTSERVRKAQEEVSKVLHLPLWSRLTHPASHRPFAVVALGVGIMLVGSFIAANKEWFVIHCGLHHLLFDTLGYFIHGVGSVPVLRYIEPVWSILAGAEEL
jgi:hypothetical protein